MEPVTKGLSSRDLYLLNLLVSKLRGSDGSVWLDQLERFIRGESCWVPVGTNMVLSTKSSSVLIPDLQKFVAREKFVVNFQQENPNPRIRRVGVEFNNRFLLGDGLIEEPTGEFFVDHQDLPSGVGPSEGLRPVTLGSVFYLMETHDERQVKVLLDGGQGNYFFVNNGICTLEVCLLYRDGGWNMHSGAIANDGKWPPGSRVFARRQS